MSLSKMLASLESTLTGFNEQLKVVLVEGVRDVARVAVEDLRSQWPVDTGASRDGWHVEETAEGARLVCSTDYSSYTFEKGDTLRTPIYLDAVPSALQAAADTVGIGVNMQDLTQEYFGQGRRTINVELDDGSVIGSNRKMIQHAPPDQAQAWIEQCPEAVTAARVLWRGKWRDVKLVPSDYLPGGQVGSMAIRSRRRR